MIKILQYGEGNFLRTFVDLYFDTLNKENVGEYSVNIVKPITFGSLERFEKQKISSRCNHIKSQNKGMVEPTARALPREE